MKQGLIATLLCAGLWLCGGCQEHIPPSDMTLNRGKLLLAAGSPKSAIPFLTQTVAATPDGPEPLALLALAYALDVQPERALAQAALVKRPAGSEGGWELVAVGIAQMTRGKTGEAAGALGQVRAESAIGPTAQQWLALAQISGNRVDEALVTLGLLAKNPNMQQTALLWTALVHSYKGHAAASSAALVACAKLIASRSGQMALTGNLTGADDQMIYDAGVAALANGDAATARRLLALVQTHDDQSSDAGVWLALIAGTQENWQTARAQLKAACEKGRPESRGLANQLFSVVCAIEERPEMVIQHTLAGQRMMHRGANSQQPVTQPQPENVWGSDNIKP